MPAHDDTQTALWTRVALDDECAGLCAQAAATDPGDVTAISRLRKKWSADEVRIALELAAARRKAMDKFPHHPDLIADVPGIEQATAHAVGQWKARRFDNPSINSVADLCCGIGGDAIALAEITSVLAIDHSPVRAWMTQTNAGCDAACADVTEWLTDNTNTYDAFHIDPARRDEDSGKRHWRIDDIMPGPAFLEQLIASGTPGAIKLGPGINREDFPPLAQTELEYISHRSQLVQAVAWCGSLARTPGTTTASIAEHNATISGTPAPAPVGTLGSWIATIDPAAERTALTHILCDQFSAPTIHPSIGILTFNEQPPASPWLTPFEVIADLPWRESKVRQWLRKNDAGIIEVKTRGKAIDPDRTQKSLRGPGSTPWTIFVLRFGTSIRALITKRPKIGTFTFK